MKVDNKFGSPGTGNREDGTPRSGVDPSYDYVLRYIEEAIDSRTPVVREANRAIKAYQGYPQSDRYLGRINKYINDFVGQDNERAEKLRDVCAEIRPRQNFTVMEAIDTMVSQAMGGVAQYECEPYDPHFYKDAVIIDKLKAAAKYAYMDNNVDAMIPQGIEFAGLAGSAYTLIEKKKKSDKVLDLTWVPATEMLLDPVRLKRNRERYIGHQTKMSWAELSNNLRLSSANDQYMLKSINEVDTYLSEVEYWIGKYNGDFQSMMAEITEENLRKDIDLFYKGSALAWVERNNKYVKHAGVSSDGDDDARYIADDVEVSYLYDLTNDIMFTVINRRYIVGADKNYMSASMDYVFPSIDPYTGQAVESANSVRIHLDHPYVPLEFKRSLWMNYAYSPIITMLDTFDDICALESLIHHTISIMTPITFTGNPTDIEKLAQIAGISGETVKGFIANSVTVLNKVVDLTPALSELQRLESKIKWIMHGPDAAEQANIIGDRASGTEATMSSAMVTQGLNPVLANVEAWASTLASKMFKFLTIYNSDEWEYNFPMEYQVASLSRKDLAGEMRFRAILKNRIKIEARQQAQTTIQWFLPLVQSELVPNRQKLAEDVIPSLADGFTRQQIASWFKLTEEQEARQRAEIEAFAAQKDLADRTNNPIDMAYVNPSGANKQFGAADIARAVSPQTYDMSSSDPEAASGGRKPGPTSRRLQYGLTQQPTSTIPIPALVPSEVPAPYEAPEVLDPDVSSELMGGDPEVAGIQSNEPIFGDNAQEYMV